MKNPLLSMATVFCLTTTSFGQFPIDDTDQTVKIGTKSEEVMHFVVEAGDHSEKVIERQLSIAEYGLENVISIVSGNNQVVLKTANGCGIGNFLVPSTGDTSQGIPPLLGTFSGSWSDSHYKVLDKVPGTQIKGVAFTRTGWLENTSIVSAINAQEPYVVISETGMFSYRIDEHFSPEWDTIYRLDSIFIPGILRMAKQITTDKNDPIVLLVEDSVNNYRIRFYSYPDLQEQFSFDFHFEPEIFEVTNDALFITGRDTSGSYVLYHFSALQDTLLAIYTLNESASNAQEFLKTGDSLFLLSSPGDSIVVLSAINIADSALAQTVIYSKSGARATYNEFQNNKYFTFQPVADMPDSVLDQQILILDPLTNQLDTFLINLHLDQFKHPQPANSGFGPFSMGWIGAKWKDGISDSVFISDAYAADIARMQTGAFPQYINATYGCWVGNPENELDKIKFEVYPNPVSSEVVINLTGLKKGSKYTLYITDISGKVHYTTYLEAYQKIHLPVQMLLKGLYFLNLNTGRSIITQKLLIQ